MNKSFYNMTQDTGGGMGYGRGMGSGMLSLEFAGEKV